MSEAVQEDGWLVAPGDPAALAEALLCALADPVRGRGTARMRADFSVAKMVEGTLAAHRRFAGVARA